MNAYTAALLCLIQDNVNSVDGSAHRQQHQRRRQCRARAGGLPPPSIKSGPLARGLARHNKRFTTKEIIKIVATRCPILRLNCTKLFVGWGTTLGELSALPQTP